MSSNFHLFSLEVVGRGSETQRQVDEENGQRVYFNNSKAHIIMLQYKFGHQHKLFI